MYPDSIASQRFAVRFRAMEAAADHAKESGRDVGVYLDSMGFLIATIGSITRDDVTLIATLHA